MCAIPRFILGVNPQSRSRISECGLDINLVKLVYTWYILHHNDFDQQRKFLVPIDLPKCQIMFTFDMFLHATGKISKNIFMKLKIIKNIDIS